MNILIPMGGIGHRFSKENYRFPKPLINIVGRPMLFWLLDNLDTKEDDIIYLGLLESLEKQFNLVQTIKMEYPNRKFESVVIDFETRGAVETLFIMLQFLNPDRLDCKTISLDCDTIYFQPILEKFRRLPSEINASFFFEDNGGKPVFSYLKLDENLTDEGYHSVTDVREKIMISTHANTGAYAFRSARILKQYCIQLLDEAVGSSGEYYTTNIIKLMLEDQERFVGIEVNINDFVCVGIPVQLIDFLKKLKTDQHSYPVRKMRFCFDLDNTLVSYPTKYGDYSTVQPKAQNIQLVRELHKAGHYIIIQTARRMRTHHGNVGAVIADIGRVTLETLAQFEIPYDEIFFGKPYAHIYIDDSAINALIDTAKEIGWVLDNTESDGEKDKKIKPFITSRDLHTIEQLDNLIIKTSSIDDLRGEIYFYENIPLNIKDLFPRLDRIETNKDAGVSSLVIEKINGITYSHLLTNSVLTQDRLQKLLLSLKRIHLSLPIESVESQTNIYLNYSPKILSRYNQYIDIYSNLDKHFQSSLIHSKELCDYLIKYFNDYETSKRGKYNSIIHGDPVFSNVLLTPQSDVIFLDMRGSLGTQLTVEGDINYDLAKVYQSLTGYDFVLLNKVDYFSTDMVKKYMSELIETFQTFISKEYTNLTNFDELKMITAQLYFTLIPLYSDFQKQIQFYKIAVQLYNESISQQLDSIQSNDKHL
ncbi:unnamed protein product [Adineta steineri]|uniref:Nucleotidyl transferase domain-containing protein n=1 Tax=Adineta steineri TaxID=433720 RepID=A0A819T6J3_9BILA|nr:unnamed protein product [Adineta steineri]CAF4074627.1 unnamed protein product [Adineta steineri]